jgi:hypothetical protein
MIIHANVVANFKKPCIQIVNMTKDEIYKKVKQVDGLGGMTVNERLYVTGLMDIFAKAKMNDKNLARIILEAIKVDTPSIDKILEK